MGAINAAPSLFSFLSVCFSQWPTCPISRPFFNGFNNLRLPRNLGFRIALPCDHLGFTGFNLNLAKARPQKGVTAWRLLPVFRSCCQGLTLVVTPLHGDVRVLFSGWLPCCHILTCLTCHLLTCCGLPVLACPVLGFGCACQATPTHPPANQSE